MSTAVGINCNTDSFWRDAGNEYVGMLPIPGVCNASVTQKGRTLSIHGTNEALKVSYSYIVSLHVNASDTPTVREENGMVIINSPKVSNIERALNGNPPVHGGNVRITPSST